MRQREPKRPHEPARKSFKCLGDRKGTTREGRRSPKEEATRNIRKKTTTKGKKTTKPAISKKSPSETRTNNNKKKTWQQNNKRTKL